MKTTHGNALTPLLVLAACLGACSNERVPIAVSASCAVDSVEGATPSGNGFAARSDARVVFRGWAGDVRRDMGPESASIVLLAADGTIRSVGTGAANGARPDVANAFGKPGMASSGFAIEGTLSGLPPGLYEIHVLQAFKDHGLACNSTRKINIQPV